MERSHNPAKTTPLPSRMRGNAIPGPPVTANYEWRFYVNRNQGGTVEYAMYPTPDPFRGGHFYTLPDLGSPFRGAVGEADGGVRAAACLPLWGNVINLRGHTAKSLFIGEMHATLCRERACPFRRKSYTICGKWCVFCVLAVASTPERACPFPTWRCDKLPDKQEFDPVVS